MKITVHMPDTLEDQIRELARTSNCSISALVVEAVERYLQEARRRQMAQAVLDMADGTGVTPDALDALHAMRRENERS
jgi:predicted transcriptional regulator